MNDEKLKIENLRMFRMILDITSDVAAEKCGLSVGFYNRIENGHITWILNYKKRAKLMKFYNRISKEAQKIIP